MVDVIPTPIAKTLPRSLETYGHFTLKPDDYRTSIALFSAKLSSGEGEYRLAIRQADQAAPDADGIRTSTATILRKLSAEPINLFMSFHMDTDLFDTATAWTDDSGGNILTDTLLEGARLKADTAYTLYALAEVDGTEVHKLMDFSTDPYPADDAVGNDVLAFSFPPPQYSFVIRNGEPFLYEVVMLKISGTFRFLGSGENALTQCSNSYDFCIPAITTISTALDPLKAFHFINKIDIKAENRRYSGTSKSIESSLQSGTSDTFGFRSDGLPDVLILHSNFIME